MKRQLIKKIQAEFRGQAISFSPGGYTDGTWSGVILEVLENDSMIVLIDCGHTVKTEEAPGWYAGLIAQDDDGQWVMTGGPDRLDCPPPPAFTPKQAVEYWRHGDGEEDLAARSESMAEADPRAGITGQ